MRRRLRPIRGQRRARFRLTWPTIVLPMVAVVVIARGETLRVPLGESEATVAVGAQPGRPQLERAGTVGEPGAAPIATIAAASVGPRLLSNAEFHLRLPGVLTGAAALGVAVILGERLFATRVGLLSAVLLLVLPAGRSLLGTQLGGEPLYLLAMLVALAAIRDVGEARASALVAGAASGLAIGVGGRDGLWLPALAFLWLRWNRGLNMRSFLAVALSTLAALAVVLVAAVSWLGSASSGAVGFSWSTLLTPTLDHVASDAPAFAWSLAPVLPLALLGLGHLPPQWSRSQSVWFVLAWLAIGAANLAATGSSIPVLVSAIYLAAMLSVWGVERARRPLVAMAVAATIAVSIAVSSAPSKAHQDLTLDRWAVREAGRFLWRTVPLERRIAASEAARGRISYYSRRPVAPLPEDGSFADADYVIVTEDEFRSALRDARAAGIDGGGEDGARLRMIAEFGPWVIARVARSSPNGGVATPPEGNLDRSGAISAHVPIT
jgi:hypothetical protein